MRTSTLLAGNIPSTTHELHEIIKSFIEPDKALRSKYGLQKIYRESSDKCLGVGGIIRTNNETRDDLIISEAVLFIKSEYIGKGIGVFVSIKLMEMATKLNNILISSVWEENSASIKLIEKNGMELKEKMIKIYKNTNFTVRTYIKSPISSQNDNDLTDISSLLLTKKLVSMISPDNIQKIA